MPKVKTNRIKYPDGWSLIEPTLNELDAMTREAQNEPHDGKRKCEALWPIFSIAHQNEPHDGKRKCEALWPIFSIAHQKSRYIYDVYYGRNEISKELYEFCLEQGHADRNLIAKWKKVRLRVPTRLQNKNSVTRVAGGISGRL